MLCTLILAVFLTFSHASDLSVYYAPDAEAIIIKGVSLPEQGAIDSFIAVYFGDITRIDIPKVIGRYEKEGDAIFFRTRYGFSPGNSYTVFIRPCNGTGEKYRRVVRVPDVQPEPSTALNNIYPTTDQLPMNQLKLYLEFTKPMSVGHAFEHIRLYRMPGGIPETEAFLVTPEELWDPDRKRLTVFFDPGRIKRGVQPNLQLGLPLVEGRRYKLVISREWLDINGAELVSGFEKIFRVVAVDRESPDRASWKIDLPKAGTHQPIQINFMESMDYGLLYSAIMVLKEDEIPVAGTIRLDNFESEWNFIPLDTWKEGNYQIVVNAWLEDLAGNNLRRKFDVDLHDPNDRPKDIEEITIPVHIKSDYKPY